MAVDSQTMPLTMLAGQASYDTWDLTGPATAGSDRRFTAQVVFEREFSVPPVVHLSLCGIDIDNRDYARLRVRAENITTAGFTVVAETWFDTQVHGFDVSWLALGS